MSPSMVGNVILPNSGHLCCITIVTKHVAHGKLFWFSVVFAKWTVWVHCRQIETFIYLTHGEPKIWPSTISLTIRYFVDKSNYTFSASFNKRNHLWPSPQTASKLAVISLTSFINNKRKQEVFYIHYYFLKYLLLSFVFDKLSDIFKKLPPTSQAACGGWSHLL